MVATKIAAIEVITITGQEAVWYFEKNADSLNIKMHDARINSKIFTATRLHGMKGIVNLNLALFISDARELTEDEKMKFDVRTSEGVQNHAEVCE